LTIIKLGDRLAASFQLILKTKSSKIPASGTVFDIFVCK